MAGGRQLQGLLQSLGGRRGHLVHVQLQHLQRGAVALHRGQARQGDADHLVQADSRQLVSVLTEKSMFFNYAKW